MRRPVHELAVDVLRSPDLGQYPVAVVSEHRILISESLLIYPESLRLSLRPTLLCF